MRNAKQDSRKLSHTLSYLLRHGAIKEGLQMRKGGFVAVRQVLKHRSLQGFSFEDIQAAVRENDKQRYTLKDIDGELFICANQGHSIPVEELDLVPITLENLPPVVIHGTFQRYWESIKSKGLNRMQRNHIHLAAGEFGSTLSGYRRDCDLLIYIDIVKAMAAGISFFKSQNDVILTTGLDGVIPALFFAKAVALPGKTLLEIPKNDLLPIGQGHQKHLPTGSKGLLPIGQGHQEQHPSGPKGLLPIGQGHQEQHPGGPEGLLPIGQGHQEQHPSGPEGLLPIGQGHQEQDPSGPEGLPKRPGKKNRPKGARGANAPSHAHSVEPSSETSTSVPLASPDRSHGPSALAESAAATSGERSVLATPSADSSMPMLGSSPGQSASRGEQADERSGEGSRGSRRARRPRDFTRPRGDMASQSCDVKQPRDGSTSQSRESQETGQDNAQPHSGRADQSRELDRTGRDDIQPRGDAKDQSRGKRRSADRSRDAAQSRAAPGQGRSQTMRWVPVANRSVPAEAPDAAEGSADPS